MFIDGGKNGTGNNNSAVFTWGRMDILNDWLRFSLIRYREITGKMCHGVVPACQQTSCSPNQKPEGNCSVWKNRVKGTFKLPCDFTDSTRFRDDRKQRKTLQRRLTEEAASIALTAA